MKDKYIDLIEQSFDFPQDEFSVEDNELNFHDIPLMELIKQYGTPLKITYLPKISQQINRAKRIFLTYVNNGAELFFCHLFLCIFVLLKYYLY